MYYLFNINVCRKGFAWLVLLLIKEQRAKNKKISKIQFALTPHLLLFSFVMKTKPKVFFVFYLPLALAKRLLSQSPSRSNQPNKTSEIFFGFSDAGFGDELGVITYQIQDTFFMQFNSWPSVKKLFHRESRKQKKSIFWLISPL